MLANLLTFLLAIVGLFLMFIVLLQRGRGGGLTGALGGLGGQSAFGTKAGDVFTRITVVVAIIWVGLNCLSIFANRAVAERGYGGRQGAVEEIGPAKDSKDAKDAAKPAATGKAAPGAATGTKSAPAAGTAPKKAAPASPAKETSPPVEKE